LNIAQEFIVRTAQMKTEIFTKRIVQS